MEDNKDTGIVEVAAVVVVVVVVGADIVDA